MAVGTSRRRFPRQVADAIFRLFARGRKGGPPWRSGLVGAGLALAVAAALLAFRPSSGPAAPSAAAAPGSSPGLAGTLASRTTAAAGDPAAVPSAAKRPAPWRILTVHRGDTLSSLFGRAGLDRAQCARVMALGAAVKTLRVLHPGDRVRLRTDGTGELTGLRYRPDALHVLKLSCETGGLQARLEHLQPVTERTSVSDVVGETLSRSLRRAGLSAATAAEFVKIFRWRVDFRREVRRGARFSVVYDTRHVANRTLPPGPIVAAELVLHDRTLRAFRFSGRHGRAGYYDAHGASMHPTLLRTPVHYTRVSSPFSLHRFNPVLHIWRPHYGVDLAAPIGTPVRAAGNGRIIFIGRDGGYGNLIKIKNFGPYSTRYGHLHRFARGLHRGSYVRQGQVIGYVGETGEATGPHLHFEIRVNGAPRNPLKVRLPAGTPLGPRQRRRFKRAIRPLVAMLKNSDRSPQQLAQTQGRFASVDRP